MRELARTLLETMVNKIGDVRADMACGDGVNARNSYCERGRRPPSATSSCAYPS